MPSTAQRKRLAEEDRLDAVFGALSDRTRRAMLRRLSEGAATVSELAEPFRISLPAISRHLKVLEDARLVERRVDGRVHHCTLDGATLQQAETWLAHYRLFWEHSLERLAQYAERDPARKET